MAMVARPKVSLTIRVLEDEKTAGVWGKLFGESDNLRLVVDWSIEKASLHTKQRITFQRIEACTSQEALERRGTELEADDLSEMTVSDLRDSYGRFLKVFCTTEAVLECCNDGQRNVVQMDNLHSVRYFVSPRDLVSPRGLVSPHDLVSPRDLVCSRAIASMCLGGNLSLCLAALLPCCPAALLPS